MTAGRAIAAREPVELQTIMPSGVEWIRVRRARREARWFIEGDLPRSMRPARRSVHRTDEYHVPTLSPDLSIKRRGGTSRLEAKTRSAAEVLTIAGAASVAERWQKWRARSHEELAGPWCAVDKQIWTLDGFEVARVSLADRRWWTFAFPLDRHEAPRNPQLAPWLARVAGADAGGSYAAWLTEWLDVAAA